mgnify:CR=1 FL=1
MDEDNDKNPWIIVAPLWAIFGILVTITVILADIRSDVKELYNDTHWMTGVLEKIHDNVEYIYNILESAN